MTRIPIYQMTYGQNSQGNTGLMFTSEQENFTSQSILFTVPIIEPFAHPIDVFNYVESYKFYFPFLLNERYMELEAKVNFPEFVFNVPETKYQVAFEADADNFYNWQYYLSLVFKSPKRPLHRNLKYVGNADKLIPNKTFGFVTLAPIDLYEMDELYLEHKGVFVGLTSNFGFESFIAGNRQ
ncbi:MAG: hypothetical protein INR73_14705 [Williamsia sp.]|nr:hypothetical protein [Williamsia sp.]